MQKGVHVCFRNHHVRHTDFRKGMRLGKNHNLLTWKRGARPAWITKEEYKSIPLEIELREIK